MAPKITRVPSAFPQKGASQLPSINLALLRRIWAGESVPWGLKRVSRVTWMLVFPGTHVRQFRPRDRRRQRLSAYLSSAPSNKQVRHKALFLGWIRAQGHSQGIPGGSKNALGLVDISLKKGHLRRQALNLTSPMRFRSWWDGPLRLQETRGMHPFT